MATIEKRGNSYRITVSCGYDSNGKQIKRKSTWKPSQSMTEKQINKAVQKAAVLFEQKVQTGQYIDSSITFKEFAEKWVKDYAEINLRQDTILGYKSMLPQIISSIGHIKLDRLQPNHLISFYKNLSEIGMRRDGSYIPKFNLNELLTKKHMLKKEIVEQAGISSTTVLHISKGQSVSYLSAKSVCNVLDIKLNESFKYKGKEKLSGNSVLHYHHLIQSILSTAVKWQVIPSNPCNRVEPPKKGNTQQIALSIEDANRLISELDSESILHKTAVLLLIYGGMRRSELYGIEWNDVNLDRLQISINKSWTKDITGKYSYGPCKNESSKRVIALPSCCRELLLELKAHQNEQKLKLGDAWRGSNAIMIDDSGNHACPNELTQWFRKFCRNNGFPESVHIHTLRHTSATLQIESHQSIKTVSARLGHSQTSTTMNIYSHAIQSADAKAADILEELLPLRKEKQTSESPK